MNGARLAEIGIGARRLPAGRPDLLVLALQAGCGVWDVAASAFEGPGARDVATAMSMAAALPHAAPRVSVRVGVRCSFGAEPSIDPGFLRAQIDLIAAGLAPFRAATLFLYNIEGHLPGSARADVLRRVREAFSILEEACSRGVAERYGVAGWRALEDPGATPPFTLAELCTLAREAAGGEHRFRAVQHPMSLIRFEPLADKVLRDRGLLRDAEDLGIDVLASAPLGRGELLSRLSPALVRALDPAAAPVEAAVRAVRSVPGIHAVLIGPRTEEQVRSLASLAAGGPIDPGRLARVLHALDTARAAGSRGGVP